MDFQYSDEQNMLADTVTRWLASDYTFDSFRRLVVDVEASKTNWARMADLGLLAINIAESDGGLGGGSVETLLVMQALGRSLVVEPFVGSAVMAVGLFNTESRGASRQRLLSGIADGSCIVAFGALEPQGRYDLNYVGTAAVAARDGFILTGRKAVVMNGDTANLLVVSARTSGDKDARRGVTLFLVDAHTPGVTIRGFPTIDGKRAAEIELKGVRIAADAVLGDLDAGFAPLEWAVDRAIAALCAEAVGAMEKLLELTTEHLRTRKQFGQPIGRFQALQHRIAEMAVAVEQARSMSLLAAAKIDDADRDTRRRAVSAAKVMIGLSGRSVGQLAVQLHGGMGMTDELPVGYYFKRLTAIDMSWGNVEHHLELYGELL